MAKVGFIGLGQMGSRMAANLVKKGRSVVAFDVSPAAVEAAGRAGAAAAGSVAEVAETCSTVVTMLPSSPHVCEVYQGADGLLAAAPPGVLFVDSSTIDPTVSRQVHADVEAKGSSMLDAPVSGGVGGAEAGTLTFMVGGAEATVDAARPVLLDMGANVVHCGGAGNGEVAKLCNNLALAVSMIGTAEAMHLGQNLGIDPSTLASVMNTSTGRCWSSEAYNPCPGVVPTAPASNNYAGGFAVDLMEKDLFLATQAGRASGSSLPLGSAAHALYNVVQANGGGNKDFSAIYLLLTGQPLGKK